LMRVSGLSAELQAIWSALLPIVNRLTPNLTRSESFSVDGSSHHYSFRNFIRQAT
jgi:hypothetical protein